MKFSLVGLVAAPFTPFSTDGRLQPDPIARQARLLAHNGVSGAFVGGTTGEGVSLTVAERRQLTEVWLGNRPANLSVIVHVGHTSLRDALELTQHAADSGADAVATMAPGLFRPDGIEGLVDWCAKIAAAAPTLPFYYYYMPSLTGLTHSVTQFLSAARDRIPNLAGVKFTNENLADYNEAALFDDGRYNLLFGRDEILLAGLALGATAAVGSTYNYMAPLYNALIKDFRKGDWAAARVHQSRANRIINCLHRHGPLAAGKVCMKLIGLDCGPVREPLTRLGEADEVAIRKELDAEGFFDWCCRLPD